MEITAEFMARNYPEARQSPRKGLFVPNEVRALISASNCNAPGGGGLGWATAVDRC
ncbi:hypothetical protein ACIGW8_27585 [Streptomyces sioyaensis]|uniref:hypothetical protein n=1 Tax=Streptomyces sioyaensis TaxID=67364 RepID=UPI0037D43F54